MCFYTRVLYIGILVSVSVDPVFAQRVNESDDPPGTYSGDLVETDGLLNGNGRFEFLDGRVYEGDFRDDRFHGTGTLSFPGGVVYSGTFVAGARTGYGTMTWPSGDRYEGSFENDVMSGQGIFEWKESGEKYDGTFVDGQKHGVGVYDWPDGRSYRGGFQHDRREGYAELRWSDGAIFRGFFVANRQHGDGIQIDADGSMEFQRWNRGNLVYSELLREIEECKLDIEGYEWMFSSRECINGLAHGTGTAVRLDGLAYINNGRFVLGKLAQGVITFLSPFDS